MDKLEKIFYLQKRLDEKIVKQRNVEFDLETWIEKEVLAIISELAELLNETNFKWWKNPKELDEFALKGEIIDIFHFVISICLKVGITPQELYDAYQDKNKENILRQEGLTEKKGYSINE